MSRRGMPMSQVKSVHGSHLGCQGRANCNCRSCCRINQPFRYRPGTDYWPHWGHNPAFQPAPGSVTDPRKFHPFINPDLQVPQEGGPFFTVQDRINVPTPQVYNHPFSPAYEAFLHPQSVQYNADVAPIPRPVMYKAAPHGRGGTYAMMDGLGAPFLPLWLMAQDVNGKPLPHTKVTLYIGRWTTVKETDQNGQVEFLIPHERTGSTIATVFEAPGHKRLCREIEMTHERRLVAVLEPNGVVPQVKGLSALTPLKLRIEDAAGKGIPFAEVTVTSQGVMEPRVEKANADGNLTLDLQNVDSVEVTVKKAEYHNTSFVVSLPESNPQVVTMHSLETALPGTGVTFLEVITAAGIIGGAYLTWQAIVGAKN